jgi:hypothetical protein
MCLGPGVFAASVSARAEIMPAPGWAVPLQASTAAWRSQEPGDQPAGSGRVLAREGLSRTAAIGTRCPAAPPAWTAAVEQG